MLRKGIMERKRCDDIELRQRKEKSEEGKRNEKILLTRKKKKRYIIFLKNCQSNQM